SGTILLYDGIDTGVVRFSSSDDGKTWSGPSAPVVGSRVADVQGAAALAEGTPLFSQDGTGFVQVYRGLDGASQQNVFTPCCGYAESLAVGAGGTAYIGFWSNASGQPGYLFGPLGGPYRSLSGSAATNQRTDRVPVVADPSGDVFVAWATDALHVTSTKGADSVLARGAFAGGDP